MGVYGRRCVRAGCRGTALFEYSDAELYNQLRYLAMLFDPEKAKRAAIGSVHFGTCSLLLFIQVGLTRRLRRSCGSNRN